jgi:hypothetical protein
MGRMDEAIVSSWVRLREFYRIMEFSKAASFETFRDFARLAQRHYIERGGPNQELSRAIL